MKLAGFSLHMLLYSICHSRAGGNPGLFSAELAWIPAFAGMTELRTSVRFAEHHVMVIFREEHEGHEGFGSSRSELRALRVVRAVIFDSHSAAASPRRGFG